MQRRQCKQLRFGNGGAPPLPWGEGWGEGVRSIVAPEPSPGAKRGLSRGRGEAEPAAGGRELLLQPQHHLGDDIALDLRRAAEDGVGSAVEIFRNHRQYLLRYPRRLVEPVKRADR